MKHISVVMEKRASLNGFSKYEYKEKAATHQMWKRAKLFFSIEWMYWPLACFMLYGKKEQ